MEDAMPGPDIVEQYKAYVADVGNIGSRYATAQTFYLSVVSALIAVVAFAGKDAAAFQKYVWVIAAFVMFFIALICYVWWRTLNFYNDLFAAKFEVLRKIEKTGALFPIFADEWAELQKRNARGLVRDEKSIPLVIGIAAVAGFILSVVGIVTGLSIGS
jgi:hypothetical protein